ncbi:UDP-3-O-(3-hydroxymyristoyl) glucosamine N-acyltransferase [Vibrio sp. qd031]|uniref:UDP-3-O-(3-hydroxymyristoyl)glucosamine N-acyltransferase n=1 Tax=Vibrio sp. qd031 TaxID=1603038 RepID=UPI000A11F03C|nr:UDP-3-O-(3-hydroxymyristoyl)glucosamine N-acyltransferase [Vibrio sp. qd031]ORT50466.1 UDP-3-O-(3-hydroxymyristoyl) glucosamine N-acyltransferase [Vibrio sp. qd031]
MITLTLQQVADIAGGTLIGDSAATVSQFQAMDKAQPGDISFLTNPKYRKHLAQCNATCVLVKQADAEHCSANAIVVDDPYVAYAKVAQKLDKTPKAATGIAPSAVISDSAILGNNVSVGANAVIETGARLADNVVIGANCFIGKNASIGEGTQLWSNVAVYHDVQIGERCLVQSQTTIGSDGFGYANEQGEWIKIPQTGSVIIGNRVEIGASACIDRGAIGNTVVEDNVILDNLIQIAHNVHIGYGTAIAGATTIAGSTTVGKYCIIGGATVINGHIEIVDQVTITGMGMVMRSIKEKGVYSSGIPLQKNAEWRKTATRVHRIDEMNKRLKTVEKLLEQQDSSKEGL